MRITLFSRVMIFLPLCPKISPDTILLWATKEPNFKPRASRSNKCLCKLTNPPCPKKISCMSWTVTREGSSQLQALAFRKRSRWTLNGDLFFLVPTKPSSPRIWNTRLLVRDVGKNPNRCLIVVGIHMNILFIIKVKIFVLTKWFHRYPQLRWRFIFEHVVQSLFGIRSRSISHYISLTYRCCIPKKSNEIRVVYLFSIRGTFSSESFVQKIRL